MVLGPTKTKGSNTTRASGISNHFHGSTSRRPPAIIQQEPEILARNKDLNCTNMERTCLDCPPHCGLRWSRLHFALAIWNDETEGCSVPPSRLDLMRNQWTEWADAMAIGSSPGGKVLEQDTRWMLVHRVLASELRHLWHKQASASHMNRVVNKNALSTELTAVANAMTNVRCLDVSTNGNV